MKKLLLLAMAFVAIGLSHSCSKSQDEEVPKPYFDDKFEIEATVYVTENDSGAVELYLGSFSTRFYEGNESYIYSASIDWGDGSGIQDMTIEYENEPLGKTNIYKSAGTYKVKITGKGLCPGAIFNGSFRTIDISKCPQFSDLQLWNNAYITSINDIIGIESIKKLEMELSGHEVNTFSITNLDGLEKATGLTNLHLTDCSLLTSADLRNFKFLKYIELNGKNLQSLNVEGDTAIEWLEIFGQGPLASLDLSGCTSLSHLFCTYSNIISINAEDSDLTYLDCPANIESISVKSISKQITIKNNKLSEENLNYIYKRLKDHSGEKKPGYVAYTKQSDIKGNTHIATARNWEFYKYDE